MRRGTKRKCGYTNPNNKYSSRNIVLTDQYEKHRTQKLLKKTHENHQNQIELKERTNFQIENHKHVNKDNQTYNNPQILNRKDNYKRSTQQQIKRQYFQQLEFDELQFQAQQQQQKQQQKSKNSQKDLCIQQEQQNLELKEEQKKQKSEQSSNIGSGSIGLTDQFVDYNQTHVTFSSKQSEEHSFKKNSAPSLSQATTFLCKNQIKDQINSEVCSNDKKSDENQRQQQLTQQQFYQKFYNSLQPQSIKCIKCNIQKFQSSSFHSITLNQERKMQRPAQRLSLQKEIDKQKQDSDKFQILQLDEDIVCVNTINDVTIIYKNIQQSGVKLNIKIIENHILRAKRK